MSPTRSSTTTPTTRPRAPRTPARVAFVGAGPGDAGLLTLRAAEYLAEADAVLLDRVAREDVVTRCCRAAVEVVDAGHGDPGQPLTTASRAKLVVRTAKANPGGLVVRLMDGDPATFNGLAEEATACARAGVPFEVVPGVSAVSAVPVYAGVPLTAGASRSVHVLLAGDRRPDVAAVLDNAATVVVIGAPEAVASTLRAVLAAGRDPATPLAVTERGTTVDQSTVVTTLAEASTVLGASTAPALAVLGPTVGLRESLSWFETRPLFGWNVLVPRTKEQSGTMTARLERYGARSTVVPTISVEPPRTPQQMERAVKGLVTGRYEWVGFTSVNAVRAIREKFTEFGLDARSFAGLKVAAVGGVTAEALLEWGINPDLVPSEEQSARGLLEEWPPFDDLLDPINRVFLPRADIATDTLVAGLQEMGWEVDDVTAYRTVRAAPPAAEVRDAIKGGAFDAVVFTSSSTVRNLVGIAGKPHPNTVVACIGPATAKTAEELGLRVDVLAPEPASAAVVDALADHGRTLAMTAGEAGESVLRPSQRKTASRRRAR
ncbi:MAG TPA: bifunctional uroporphyrinogen-III C-methyltransferase/uroporphyrinogen-III synthase [Dermatophilaceae bacterium]|nr:bifunctional uroporphyrinogen-III C-methyltransferase/uroporphyrinogen-III synthase [Dermatophilaceae bacterium]